MAPDWRRRYRITASIATAAASSSGAKRWAYIRRVTVGLEWPRRLEIFTTSIPAAISAEAWVCRSAWKLTVGSLLSRQVAPAPGQVIRRERLAVTLAEYEGIGRRLAQPQLHPQFKLGLPVLAQQWDDAGRQ